jgi:hypothetical protein
MLKRGGIGGCELSEYTGCAAGRMVPDRAASLAVTTVPMEYADGGRRVRHRRRPAAIVNAIRALVSCSRLGTPLRQDGVMGGLNRGLQQEWDDLLAGARLDDARSVPGQWPPPLRTGLVLAARGSALGVLHPVVSLTVLWFCASPLPGAAQDILPVGIGIATDPDEYVVWWGHPFRLGAGRRPVIQLLTTEATEAVDLAVLLFRAWRIDPGTTGTST